MSNDYDFLTQMVLALAIDDGEDLTPVVRPEHLRPDDAQRFKDLFLAVDNRLYADHGLRLIPRDESIPLDPDFELPEAGILMRPGDFDALRIIASKLNMSVSEF